MFEILRARCAGEEVIARNVCSNQSDANAYATGLGPVTLRQPALRRAELPPPIPRSRAVSIRDMIVDSYTCPTCIHAQDIISGRDRATRAAQAATSSSPGRSSSRVKSRCSWPALHAVWRAAAPEAVGDACTSTARATAHTRGDGSRSEQPIQESQLICMPYGLRDPRSPRLKPSLTYACTPAQLRTLMQRLSAACCSRSCARSSNALLVHAHAGLERRVLLAQPDQMSPQRPCSPRQRDRTTFP